MKHPVSGPATRWLDRLYGPSSGNRLSRLAVILVVLTALAVAAWRLSNPPIEYRMAVQLGDARRHMIGCEFEDAFQAYLEARALDGTEERALRGMQEVREIMRAIEEGMYIPGCTMTTFRHHPPR